MKEERVFKSKILLIVTEMIKEKDNEQTIYQVVNKHYENISGCALESSLKEEKELGRVRTVKIVNHEPEQIEFGVVYVLLGGKRAWIYNLLGEEEE